MSGPYEKYLDSRNYKPKEGKPYEHQYRVEGPELQDIIQANPQFFEVIDIDLSVAQSFTAAAAEVNIAGHGLVPYGYTTSTKYDPIANTGIETNVTTIFIACRFQQNLGGRIQTTNEFHLKHNRGFWGTFSRLYLAWPAQASNSCRLYIYKSKDYPFFTGEAST
jgi:hypothetical protein